MVPEIALPVVVLGFGDLSVERKLLAVSDGLNAMLPVFTDPEAAERYRIWQNAQMDSYVLPISATGNPEDYNPTVLNTFVLDSAQQVRDVLEVAMMLSGVITIALNPSAGESIPCLCLDIEEFFGALGIL